VKLEKLTSQVCRVCRDLSDGIKIQKLEVNWHRTFVHETLDIIIHKILQQKHGQYSALTHKTRGSVPLYARDKLIDWAGRVIVRQRLVCRTGRTEEDDGNTRRMLWTSALSDCSGDHSDGGYHPSTVDMSYLQGHIYKLFPHCNWKTVFLFTAYITHVEQPIPAKPDDFSSLVRFTRFVRSIDLFRFLFLRY